VRIRRPVLCKRTLWTADADAARCARSRSEGEMNTSLAPAWPCVAHVAQRTRTVTNADTTTTEVVSLLTTLPASKASPEPLLELNRGHWSNGHRTHAVRDVRFKEDRSRLRTGNAPQILAAFRHLAITLIHRFGTSHSAATQRPLCRLLSSRSSCPPFTAER
jgi:predicted transposase YbfD/YdcC